MKHINITIPIPNSYDIKGWWFRMKVNYLRKRIERTIVLYNKHCKKKRIFFDDCIEGISPAETKALWDLLRTVRDLEANIAI